MKKLGFLVLFVIFGISTGHSRLLDIRNGDIFFWDEADSKRLMVFHLGDTRTSFPTTVAITWEGAEYDPSLERMVGQADKQGYARFSFSAGFADSFYKGYATFKRWAEKAKAESFPPFAKVIPDSLDSNGPNRTAMFVWDGTTASIGWGHVDSPASRAYPILDERDADAYWFALNYLETKGLKELAAHLEQRKKRDQELVDKINTTFQ